MGMTRFTKHQIEILRSLQEAHEKGEGDTSWIDDLPELPDRSAKDSVVAIMIPKRKSEESDESNA